MNPSPMSAAFLSLPSDVLSIVANCLPISAIFKTAATCQQLKSSLFPLISKVDAFIGANNNKKNEDQYIVSFNGLSQCTRLRELLLHDGQIWDANHTFDALKDLPKLTNLRSLRVPLCIAVPGAHILSIFSLRHLTRLELTNFFNESRETGSDSFKASVISSLAEMSELRELNLSKFSVGSNAVPEHEIINSLLKLEKIEKLWTPSSLTSWNLLAPLQSLQTLIVCDYDSSQSIRYISICDTLDRYELTTFFNVLVPKLRALRAIVIASFVSPHNGAESHWTFVGAAARALNPVMLKWMLEENADIASFHVEARDLHGFTPLMHVREPSAARYLLSKGANVNAIAEGPNPLGPFIKTTLLSRLAKATTAESTDSFANVMIFRTISENPELDYNLGEPKPLILALRHSSLLLKLMLKVRPQYLAQQPYLFIQQCRRECQTEGQWTLLQSVLPETIVAQLNAEFGPM